MILERGCLSYLLLAILVRLRVLSLTAGAFFGTCLSIELKKYDRRCVVLE